MHAEARPSVVRRLGAEFAKFGLVGVVNYALDLAVFNLLLFTVLGDSPWAAKACSTVVAATSSYFMNRHWTWRERARSGTTRELSIFLVISGVALGVTELCLFISHAVLGLATRLDDNISANVVGVILATVVRFWAFRTFVFRDLTSSGERAADPGEDDVQPTPASSAYADLPGRST